jgi:NAD(P)-dependent dehydrogenase (short-subunit alcohol dehydrogenase family)
MILVPGPAQKVVAKGVTVNTVSPGYIGTDMFKAIRADVSDRIVVGISTIRLVAKKKSPSSFCGLRPKQADT